MALCVSVWLGIALGGFSMGGAGAWHLGKSGHFLSGWTGVTCLVLELVERRVM